jgi:RpiB/LacA/LacB family sugar-phosphate isomerase
MATPGDRSGWAVWLPCRSWMRIALGSDHAGFPLKEHLATWLAESGHAVYDLGTHSADPVDYPDYSAAVAQAVLDGRADRGIIVCGSGAGAAIAANKFQGIRAGVAHDTYTAHQMVEHDDVNVLALGSRVIGQSLAEDVVRIFIEAKFSRDDRHVRRLDKIRALEA